MKYLVSVKGIEKRMFKRYGNAINYILKNIDKIENIHDVLSNDHWYIIPVID